MANKNPIEELQGAIELLETTMSEMGHLAAAFYEVGNEKVCGEMRIHADAISSAVASIERGQSAILADIAKSNDALAKENARLVTLLGDGKNIDPLHSEECGEIRDRGDK